MHKYGILDSLGLHYIIVTIGIPLLTYCVLSILDPGLINIIFHIIFLA